MAKRIIGKPWLVPPKNSGAATAQTLARAGEAGRSLIIASLDVFTAGGGAVAETDVTLRSVDTAGDVQLVLWQGKIPAGGFRLEKNFNVASIRNGEGQETIPGIEVPDSLGVELVVASAGAAISTIANLIGYTMDVRGTDNC